MTSPSRRPGLARADRRERDLVREWLLRLDEPPLRAALLHLLEAADVEAARPRLLELATSLGVVLPEGWDAPFDATQAPTRTAHRLADGVLLTLRDAEGALFVTIRGDTVRIDERHGAPPEDASQAGLAGLEHPIGEAIGFDDAVAEAAAPMWRWLRQGGGRPEQASRLAALFSPRSRVSEWPSSPN